MGLTHDNGAYVIPRHVRLRCWLAKRILGAHGSVTREMVPGEWEDYIRRSVEYEAGRLRDDTPLPGESDADREMDRYRLG